MSDQVKRGMSDLEDFGRHVGVMRVLEPRNVRVTCPQHTPKGHTVGVMPDENIVVCCWSATADAPYKFHIGLAPGRDMRAAFWLELT